MKKFYFLFLFALIASIGNLYAAEKTVTFDATVDKSSSMTLSKDGITLLLTDGKLNNGTDYRPYAGSTLTISSEYTITKIVFTCAASTGTKRGGPDKFSVTKGGGKYEYKGFIGTWTGSAVSISFKADKQVQAKTIEVTYDAPDVPSCGVPTFSVEGGTYKEAQAIELRAGEGGTQVFYTINDGTEQQYIGEPIKLEEDGTYKITAYTAANGALAKSTTVTKTYVISLPLDVPYILCEDAAWLTDGAKIIFVGKNLTSGETFGMTSQGTNTYRSQGGVTLSEDGNFLNDKEAEVRVFSVERSGAKMAFKDVEGYLYTNNAKNSIRTKETIADDCYWTVSIGTDNVASVVSSSLTKETDYRNIKYNASSYRFAAYNDSYEGKVYIYLLGSTSSVSSMSAEGVKVFAAEGGVEVVAEEAAEVAVYTAAGQLVRQARVAEGSTLVNVAPGFYVVRANDTATKVIVR